MLLPAGGAAVEVAGCWDDRLISVRHTSIDAGFAQGLRVTALPRRVAKRA